MVAHGLVRGETGYLPIFSLTPKTPGKPTFNARVDDGSPGNRKPEIDLDIDIEGVSVAVKRAFKARRHGYCGHHNDRSPDPAHRVYDVCVATPEGKVFVGTVSFNAAFAVGAVELMTATATCDATVIRAVR